VNFLAAVVGVRINHSDHATAAEVKDFVEIISRSRVAVVDLFDLNVVFTRTRLDSASDTELGLRVEVRGGSRR